MESHWWIWHISRSHGGHRGQVAGYPQEPLVREAK